MSTENKVSRSLNRFLVGSDTVVPAGNSMLTKIQEFHTGDSVQTFKKPKYIVGHQSDANYFVNVYTKNGAILSLAQTSEVTILNSVGELITKQVMFLEKGDILFSQVDQYKYKVDPISYELGRMSALSDSIKSIIAFSHFIVNHPVQYSISWLEGYLNGSRDITFVCDEKSLKYVKILMNRISSLYASVGISTETEVKDDFIVVEPYVKLADYSIELDQKGTPVLVQVESNTDWKLVLAKSIDLDQISNLSENSREIDPRKYMNLSINDVMLNQQGDPVIVALESNVEWSVNKDPELVPVKKVHIKFLSDEETIIPSEYGRFIYTHNCALSCRCWNKCQQNFLNGVTSYNFNKFMDLFENVDAISEPVKNGLRFSYFDRLEETDEKYGFNLSIKDNEPYVANGYLLNGVESVLYV